MTASGYSFLDFGGLFSKAGVLGLELAPRLAGQRVRMRGYLSPAHHDAAEPLVLTRTPFAACSDCGTEHDWPADGVFVFPAAGQPAFAPGRLTEVEGVLDHGPLRLDGLDAVSLVRLRDATWRDQ